MGLKENLKILIKSPRTYLSLLALGMPNLLSANTKTAENALNSLTKNEIVLPADVEKDVSEKVENVIDFSAIKNLSPTDTVPADTSVVQMVEYFRSIFGEKGYLDNEAVKDSLAKWERIDEKVDWRRDEKEDIDSHLKDIKQNFGKKSDRIKRTLKMASHKIHSQIKEEKESVHQKLSPTEIAEMLKEEGFINDIADVGDIYIGDSDYIVFIVPHSPHGPIWGKGVKEHQDKSYEIQQRLLSKGIKISFAREGFWNYEFDDKRDLTTYYDTIPGKAYEKTIAMRTAKDHTSYGLEQKENKAEANAAGRNFLCANECYRQDYFAKDKFPMSVDDYTQIQWDNILNNRGGIAIYIKDIRDFLKEKNQMTFADHQSLYDHFREEFNRIAINERNEVWADETDEIAKNTRCEAIFATVGKNHLREKIPPSYYKHLSAEEFDEKTISLQDAYKAEKISHVVITPIVITPKK